MQVATTRALAALALLAALGGGCVHEVKRVPSPSLLPAGKVAVIGEVGRPGLIDFRPGMTLLDALRAAGGLAPQAQADAALLTRNVSGLTASTSVHIAAIVDGREPDVPLEDGDVVQVPSQGPRRAAPRGPTPPSDTTEPPPEQPSEPPAGETPAQP